MNKITVIGTGSVGATIAYSLTITGTASEIVLIDINKDKAVGEALDIRQGTPFCNPCTIIAGDYPEAAGSNIVIITSGVARKPGQSRLDLAQVNVNIMKTIIPQITKYAPDATYVIVSNPVDIMTYTFCKLSGIPENRVIGSGTLLDSARLRSRMSEYYGINQTNVHACVLGEHGDSSFIPWSVANISGIPVTDYAATLCKDGNYPAIDKNEVEEYVRKTAANVIACKGATYYAVSMAVCNLCKAIIGGLDTSLAVSTMMNGEYGISDVCLSVLCNIGKGVVSGKVMLPLTDDEVAQLRHSADCLKSIISQTTI